ncbi:MAG: MMPL family transporter [Pseudohongiellaceae bacterium]
MRSRLRQLYCSLVFDRPWLVVALLMATLALFGWYAQYFRLDVSADSLMMEGDEDLAYSRQISERYRVQDSVIVAVTPDEALFSPPALEMLQRLREDLLDLERIESVTSLLDVPVFGDTRLTGISSDYDTVLTEGIDLDAAREEITQSPIFRNAVVSPDGGTTALQANFRFDERYFELIGRRTELREKQAAEGLTSDERQELREVSDAFDTYSLESSEQRHEDIARIRGILDQYRDEATLYLGGAPMIADDLVTFVQSDLATFSLGVLAFIVVALGVIFRRLRWVFLPLACCAVAGVIVVGILGMMDWRVTVVSSNFISLLMIITISLTVHLIVRYRELRSTRHHSSQARQLRHAVLVMFRPCLYTALTTIVAFGSLLVSGINPIISFGWMMVMGVAAALLVVFLLFPAMMSLLPVEKKDYGAASPLPFTDGLARLTDRAGGHVLWVYGVVLAVSLVGVSRLEVENAFINYFSEDTEIHQGMELIDQKLGGTLAMDVVVDLSGSGEEAPEEEEGGAWWDDGDEESSEAYWFTGDRMDELQRIHQFLDAHPQTGKVLSFGAVVELAEQLNGDEPVDSFLWAVLYDMLPDTLRETVLTPFVSIEDNQARFNVRVMESDPDLDRDQLIRDVEQGLQEELGYSADQIHVTGMLVLYNNVLQSLYESQILTLGVVLLAIMIMFLVLFRSPSLAALCIIPNIIAAGFVLGLMGWLAIPLDIMTITIAAISIGIGVDNTIHYMHRFRREFNRIGNYRETMFFCHNSIARAMFFTSMTIVAGFSILVLSNFIPTIVFGLLTSIAMLVALIGALTLLPQLLITFKPLGPEQVTRQEME